MYNVDDIQIFIITAGRTAYLKDAVVSCLKQSAKLQNLCVLDNSSAISTPPSLLTAKNIIDDIKKDYPNTNIIYTNTHDMGRHGNYFKLMELVNRKYFAVFHDDDIVHPQYIEYILNFLNSNPGVEPVLFGTAPKSIYKEDDYKSLIFDDLKNEFWVSDNLSLFINFIHNNKTDCVYPSIVCNTEAYKKTDNFKLFEKYGKISDSAKIYSVASHGKVAILKDAAYLYRQHSNQDAKTSGGLTLEQYKNFVHFLNKKSSKLKYSLRSRYFAVLKEYYALVNTEEILEFDYLIKKYLKLSLLDKFYFELCKIPVNRHNGLKNRIKWGIVKLPYKFYLSSKESNIKSLYEKYLIRGDR